LATGVLSCSRHSPNLLHGFGPPRTAAIDGATCTFEQLSLSRQFASPFPVTFPRASLSRHCFRPPAVRPTLLQPLHNAAIRRHPTPWPGAHRRRASPTPAPPSTSTASRQCAYGRPHASRAGLRRAPLRYATAETVGRWHRLNGGFEVSLLLSSIDTVVTQHTSAHSLIRHPGVAETSGAKPTRLPRRRPLCAHALASSTGRSRPTASDFHLRTLMQRYQADAQTTDRS
jgi:hypothetical protein